MESKFLFYWTLVLALIFSLIVVNMKTYAAEKEGELYFTSPLPKSMLGEKWRFGYVEGDKFKGYQALLIAVIQGLVKLGWIDSEPEIQPDETDTSEKLWHWLATEVASDYIEFVADAYWSATAEDEEQQEKNNQAILKRLEGQKNKEQRDIDLIIGMGDKAGKVLATDRHDTNTVLMAISDPVRIGVAKRSGDFTDKYKYIFTQVDLDFYKRQLELFHDIFGFKTLGITYQDDENGRKVAGVKIIEETARQRGFKLRKYPISSYQNPDIRKGVAELLVAHYYLAPRIQAMYLTINTALDNPKNIKLLLNPLNKRKVYTFSQGTGDYVKQGVLMSITATDQSFLGAFYAEKIAKILNGATPNQLEQRYETPTSIALNLEVAKNLGWEIPVEVLTAVDEVYMEIACKEKKEGEERKEKEEGKEKEGQENEVFEKDECGELIEKKEKREEGELTVDKEEPAVDEEEPAVDEEEPAVDEEEPAVDEELIEKLKLIDKKLEELVVDEKPVVEEEPVIQEPVTQEKPAINQVEEKPVTEEKPVVDEKANEKPVVDEKLIEGLKQIDEGLVEELKEIDEEPIVEEKSVTEEEPVADEKADEKPVVDEKLIEGLKQIDEGLIEELKQIDEEPIVEEKLVTEEKPVVDEKADEKPVVDEKLIEGLKQIDEGLLEELKKIDEEPIVEEKAVVDEELIEELKQIDKEPIVEEKSITEEEPVVEEPAVDEKADERPVVDEKLIEELKQIDEGLIEELRKIDEEPMVEEKPIVKKKPAVAKESVVDEKPVVDKELIDIEVVIDIEPIDKENKKENKDENGKK